MNKTRKLILIILSIGALSIGVFGQADKLQDLVNARAGQAEGDLENRGYRMVRTEQADGAIFSYWWNSRAKKCVSVKTVDGRYAVIVDAMKFSCDQAGNNSNSSQQSEYDRGFNDAVNSRSRNNYNNSKDYDVGYGAGVGQLNNNRNTANGSEYDRGYNDAINSRGRNNRNNSRDYDRGYGAGVGELNNRLNANSSGYGKVNLSDLQGARASSGESEMARRGFRNVDGFKAGETSYTIWFNRNNRQCVQVATVNGRYDSIANIDSHPKCR